MGAVAVDIGKTIHPHPTLGESIGMAATLEPKRNTFLGRCQTAKTPHSLSYAAVPTKSPAPSRAKAAMAGCNESDWETFCHTDGDGKLGPTDMQGVCYSISSLGGIAGRYFCPIINAHR